MHAHTKTLFLALAVALTLFVALLAGIRFASVTAPPPPATPGTDPEIVETPSPKGVSTPIAIATSEASTALVQQLQAVKSALQTAKSEMAKASLGNKGGFVPKIRTDITNTLSHLALALDFAAAHPEAAQLPPAPALLDFSPVPPGKQAPHLRTAAEAVRRAGEEFQKLPGHDLGGLRANLLSDLQQTASDLASGIAANEKAALAAVPAAPPATRP